MFYAFSNATTLNLPRALCRHCLSKSMNNEPNCIRHFSFDYRKKKTIVGSTLNTLLCHCHALYKIRKPNHLFFARKNCVHFVCGGTQTDHLIGPYSKTRLEIFIQPSQRAMHICSRVESFHVRRTIRFFFPMNCIQSPGSCLLRTSFPLSHFWAEMCSLACMLQCGWPFGILARLVVLFGLMMSRWSIFSTI